MSDLNLLWVLDAVLQEESITRAAKRLKLSVPATGHAVARLREQLGDPILVRAGRSMVLTPRALAMRERARAVTAEAAALLAPPEPSDPQSLRRTFVVRTTDYATTLYGARVLDMLQRQAPGVDVRFTASCADNADALRDGSAELVIGLAVGLPPEIKTRLLCTDRWVCLARRNHPTLRERVTIDDYIALQHVQIVPFQSGAGKIERSLSELGLQRRILFTLPTFMSAFPIVAQTDALLTVSERLARRFGPMFGLEMYELPLPMPPYAIHLVWHPRMDGDVGHRLVREVFVSVIGSADRDHAADRKALPRGSGEAHRREEREETAS